MGEERPTLDTVAAAAGVSRMTVSNAYNRPDQLSPATRERVLAVAEQLGYGGPDPAARSLRRGQVGHGRSPAHRAALHTRSPTRASCRCCAASPASSARRASRCCSCPRRPTTSATSCAARWSTPSSSARWTRHDEAVAGRRAATAAPGDRRPPAAARSAVPRASTTRRAAAACRRPPARARPPPSRRRRPARSRPRRHDEHRTCPCASGVRDRVEAVRAVRRRRCLAQRSPQRRRRGEHPRGGRPRSRRQLLDLPASTPTHGAVRRHRRPRPRGVRRGCGSGLSMPGRPLGRRLRRHRARRTARILRSPRSPRTSRARAASRLARCSTSSPA